MEPDEILDYYETLQINVNAEPETILLFARSGAKLQPEAVGAPA